MWSIDLIIKLNNNWLTSEFRKESRENNNFIILCQLKVRANTHFQLSKSFQRCTLSRFDLLFVFRFLPRASEHRQGSPKWSSHRCYRHHSIHTVVHLHGVHNIRVLHPVHATHTHGSSHHVASHHVFGHRSCEVGLYATCRCELGLLKSAGSSLLLFELINFLLECLHLSYTSLLFPQLPFLLLFLFPR